MQSPLILSGPSGVGKTYLEKYLIQNYPFKRMLSTTTRAQRQNEIHGTDYEFLTEEQYKIYETEGAFITSVYNLNAWYGIRKELVDTIIQENKIPTCVIVPQIIDQIIQAYPTTNAVFLRPESRDLLISRMKLRGDSEEKITKRLEQTLIEIELYEKRKHFYKACLTVTKDNFDEITKNILKYYNL